MSDNYGPSETARLTGGFATGSTVTITIYKLSTDDAVVSDAACDEIGTSGYFQYDYEVPDNADEYLWVMTDGTNDVSGNFQVSGYAFSSALAGTWTFESNFNLVRDQIRSMVGDTNSNDPLISDEAIAFYYDQAGSVAEGALRTARAIVASLALDYDRDIDGLKSSRSQRHKAMLAVVKQIEDNIIVDDFSYDIGSGATTISDSTSYPYELEHADLGRPDWNESD